MAMALTSMVDEVEGACTGQWIATLEAFCLVYVRTADSSCPSTKAFNAGNRSDMAEIYS